MPVNIEQIKAHYSKLDSAQLKHIAQYEAAGLAPEVLPILREEIKKRGLDSSLLKSIEAQTEAFDEELYDEMLTMIKHLDCPVCGESHQGVEGSIIRKVISMIVITNYEGNYLGCLNSLKISTLDKIMSFFKPKVNLKMFCK